MYHVLLQHRRSSTGWKTVIGPRQSRSIPILQPENNKPEKPVSYRSYTNKVKRVAGKTDLNCKLSGETNHVWRKGRISYLKKADIMNETMIDKRVGHVQGSDQTRVYTRINDEQAGNAYLQGYGLEDEITDHVEEDVLPLECSCGVINSGHRKSCRKCGQVLDEDNYLDGVKIEPQIDKDVEEKAQQIQKNIIRNSDFDSIEERKEVNKLIFLERKITGEINLGYPSGMLYTEIKKDHQADYRKIYRELRPEEFEKLQQDKKKRKRRFREKEKRDKNVRKKEVKKARKEWRKVEV